MTSILLVDDRATDRELLVTVLRYAGYSTLEADTGVRGLELAREQQPDLIIADILMPTMDGYELVRELRSDPATSHIPVVFYTATYVLDEARRLADALGVSHILVKPCEPDEIVRVVGEALATTERPTPVVPPEEFHREHLRLLNSTLLRTIEELRNAVIPSKLAHVSEQRVRLAGGGTDPSRPDLARALSRRELEVLAAVAEGETNAEIAERLVITQTTVQSHVKRILRKLGVRNRTEAAIRYWQSKY